MMNQSIASIGFSILMVSGPTAQSINNFQHAKDLQLADEPGIAQLIEKGEGDQTMVLIAGAPFGAGIWEEFMERNATRYRMLAITPAGYGGTAPPDFVDDENFGDRVWTDAIIDDLAAAIEARDLKDVVVVGHHLMGDYYAVRLAVEHPDLVSSVVVLAGQGSQPAGAPSSGGGRMIMSGRPRSTVDRAKIVQEQRVPMYRNMKAGTWANGTFPGASLSRDVVLGQRLYRQQLEVPLPTQLGYYMEYLTDDLSLLLPKLELPTLVLQLPASEIDISMLPKAMVTQLMQRFDSEEEMMKSLSVGSPWNILARQAKSKVTVETIDKSGAFVMIDQPDLVDERIAAFLQR